MFPRFLNKKDIRPLVEARFPPTPLARSVLSAWETNAAGASEEAEDAFQALSQWTWWEAPKDLLFAVYGGIGFIPDDVFSYFLPGCIGRCLFPIPDVDGIDRTLHRLAARTYEFQTLANRQVLAVGWFVYYLSLRPALAYDGRFAIVRSKIDMRTSDPSGLREKYALSEAFVSSERNWSRQLPPVSRQTV